MFELSKVETRSVRDRMLAQLANVRTELAERVARGLGMPPVDAAPALAPTRTDLPASPALSLLAKARKTLQGRKIGVLVDDGFDAALLAGLRAAALQMQAMVAVVAPRVGGAMGADGKLVAADFQLAGGASVLFDSVAILAPNDSTLAHQAEAVAWVHDAFAHLKVIAHTEGAAALMAAAGVRPDEGVVDLAQGEQVFLIRAAGGRIWAREAKVRVVY